MHLKVRRWVLILDALLLLGALVFSAYKMAARVLPLKGVDQLRQRPNAQAQILEYYRQYPERYIRIANESWQYDDKSRMAFHSFTLKNTATIPYAEIEIRLSYESSSGKNQLIQNLHLSVTLGALGTMEIKKLKVKNVPAASARVVASIVKASVVR